MKKLFPFFVLFLVCIIACGKKETVEPVEPCNQGVLIEDCVCITVYEPVCGCNEVTYGNSCNAACDGISDYTAGECQ